MKKRIIISLIIISIISWGFKLTYDTVFKQELDPVYIAVAGPLSKLFGKSLLQGVELYFEKINKQGGINGRKIFIDKYDDENDPKKAKEIAKKIYDQKRALAVIGHWYSSCSISAGEIYKKYKIPAITPGSTNVRVTRFNKWYFRTVFNDNLQARFLENYAKKVLKYNSVNIIYDEDDYGSILKTVYEAKARNVGININFIKGFNAKKTEIDKDLENIVKNLQNKIKENYEKNNEEGLIFLATHANEGVKLVKLIKDFKIKNPIMGPDSFASRTFLNGFDSFPKEKENPGFYTDGILTATHLIFDTANEKAQELKEAYQKKYKEDPDWIVAYSYDTAMVIAEAIKNLDFQKKRYTIEEDRFNLRATISKINSIEKAVKGCTGLNYFNKRTGDAAGKPVSIGIYKNKNLISALTQLQAVENIETIQNIDKAKKQEQIFDIDGKYMYRTDVVYTGVELNEISDFDQTKLICNLDFYVWFRYQMATHFDPTNIEFLNNVDPVEKVSKYPEKIAKDKDLKVLVKQESSYLTPDMIMYYLYRVKGRFRVVYSSEEAVFDQYNFGISFKHKDLTRNNLIYVIDFLGMGRTREDKQYLNPGIIKSLAGWSVDNSRFFQNVIEKSSPGSPEYIESNTKSKFSRFNYIVTIKKNEFSLRGLLPRDYVFNLFLISFCALLILTLLVQRPGLKKHLRTIWFFQSIFSIFLLLSCEVVLIDKLMNKFDVYHLKLIKKFFDILWWLIPAFLLNLATKRFLWIPLEEKAGHKIPGIIRHFLSFIIYLIAFIGIVAFVFNQEISKLLATGGLFAMIIGFAIQMNISNLISGIAINLENPFRVGDWIKINDSEGKVVDITWRSTRIQTEENCILSIPNSAATESFISNYNYPDDLNWLVLPVHILPEYSPDHIRKILKDAVLSANTVLEEPEPHAVFKGLNDWSAEYHVKFCIPDYANKERDTEIVWNRVWIHLRYAGIEIALYDQELIEVPEKPFSILHEAAIFKPLSQDTRMWLESKLHPLKFSKGTTILKEGSPGDSIFVILEGVVSINIGIEADAENNEIEIYRLGVGEFFGEMAFLSGDYRVASVIAFTDLIVYEIMKADVEQLIKECDELLDIFQNTKHSRRKSIVKQKQRHRRAQLEKQEISISFLGNFFENLFLKIKNYFIKSQPGSIRNVKRKSLLR